MGYPDGFNNFAYVNNGVTMALDRFGTDIVHLVDPNGAVFGAGHSAWMIGNEQDGYTTYDYRPEGSESSSGSASTGSPETKHFDNFSDALDYLNSGRVDGHKYVKGQTLYTTREDDTIANWSAHDYMNEDYSLTSHNCYQLGQQLINDINRINNTNYQISQSMIPNTAFQENLNYNWWQTAIPE
jgi:hypothetical protein